MGFALVAVVGAMVMMAYQTAMEEIEGLTEDDLGEEVLRDGDSVAGSNGDDVISGNDASEFILPHTGNDVVYAGDGDDTVSDHPFDVEPQRTPAGLINPDWSNDTIYGEGGNDRLLGTGGADVIYGGEGDDRITTVDLHADAPYAPDQAFGDAGNDWLVGDDGDTLTGGAGVDFFSVAMDEEEEEAVVITDFSDGERLDILIYDAALLNDDGTVPDTSLRDTDDGAVLTVGGMDAVVFADSLAQDLNGNIRVLDARNY